MQTQSEICKKWGFFFVFRFLQDPVRYQDTEKVHHDLRWLPQSYGGDFLADNSSLVEYYWAPEPEKMIQIVRRKTAIKKQENTFKEQRDIHCYKDSQ